VVSNALSMAMLDRWGAVGNVISIRFRATMAYAKQANGGVMISLLNRLADAHFRKEPSGRLVFIPFTRKGKCYFVDSKADEEKIRAFVNLYRIPNTLMSLLMNPMVVAPGLIMENLGGLTPRAHRLTIVLGISGLFWLSFVGLALMLLGRLQNNGSRPDRLAARGWTRN
jgi:hypothetical protein